MSPSSEARDRGIKFTDYAAHGVREYWIVDTVAETVELYRLNGSSYPQAEAQHDGVLSSEVILALDVPVRAIFDDQANLAALRAFMGK